jgi:hypothetical protein
MLMGAEVCLLVVNDGLGDVSLEEVFPIHGYLLLWFAEQRVIARASMWYAGLVAEPLDDALGNEDVEQLCCVAFVVEVVPMNGENTGL